MPPGHNGVAGIHIIGTSHISRQSIGEIEDYIEREKPGIVAVELDARRYQALQEKRRGPGISALFKIGFKGFLFGIIGYWVEHKLGEIVGVKPGSEMLHAIKLARKHGLQIAFIDQDIEITLRRLSAEITWREKWRFVADIVKGIFTGRKQLREMGLEDLDLSRVPEKKVIAKMLERVRQRYPSIYKVLVRERNNIMARNLLTLASFNPGLGILAVVGAGHEDGIKEIIGKNREGKIDYTFSISAGSQSFTAR
jgi:pheromone shutdown-related protein TraB